MNKKCFLHIGTHKTGTTALQSFLRINKQRLREHGVLIPVSGCIDPYSGHHNIAWELNDDHRFQGDYGTLDDLCAEINGSDCHTVVVSSEDFEYLHSRPAALITLKQRLNDVGCQVEVILFFRQWGEYIISLYAELLKHGLDISFRTFKKQILDTGIFVMRGNWKFCFHYERLVRDFANIFGKRHLHCNGFEVPIEPKFLNLIGVQDLEGRLERVAAANESISMLAGLALLKFNQKIEGHGADDKERSRNTALALPIVTGSAAHTEKMSVPSLWDILRFAVRFRRSKKFLHEHCRVSLNPLRWRGILPHELRMDQEYHRRRPEIHRLADHAYDTVLASQDHST
ncbi:hypothetical protein [Acidithiobacillus ferrianus]|uniref:hypothetical protein n=1 Tax=Acidithiobacillus ferrianus TaxID=2678518 RepID=UPI0034E5AC41